MRKNFLWLLLAVNLAALPALYWLGRPVLFHGVSLSDTEALPVYGQMPSFQLTQQDGKRFGNEQMKGALWIADFMFTRCPNQCPLMSVQFSALQKKLPKEARLASFTVDPEHDDPQTLKAYAQNYQADPDRWLFLTGDPPVIRRIMNDLHLGRADDPGMHSLRFVLLDKALRVRGYYDSTDAGSLSKLAPDIGRLRREK